MAQDGEEKKQCTLLETGRQIPIITTAPSIAFDDIIQQVGPFGRYQITIWILTSLFDVLIACQLMFFLFGGANPGWYCIPPDFDHNYNLLVDPYANNDSISSSHVGSTVVPGGGLGYMNHDNHNNISVIGSGGPSEKLLAAGYLEVLEKRPRGIMAQMSVRRHLVRPEWDGVCRVNGTKCAAIVFKPGVTTIVTEFSLTCDMVYASTFFTTLAMVGILVGAAVGGQLADMFGRRPIFFSLAFAMLLCQLSQSFADSWQMFAGFRFCAGFLSGAFMVVTYIIPLEIVGRQWRTVCGCMGFWQVGQMVLAGIALLISNWRHLSVATAVLCAPLLISWFAVHESPRWLIQKGRLTEAYAILRKMAKTNRREPPSETLLKQINKEEASSHKYSFLDLVKHREYAKRTLIVYFLWFNCTMTYYGLSLGARDLSNDVGVNVLIMGFAEMIFVTSVIYAAYKFGRRPALLVYFSISCCCLIASVTLNATNGSILAQSILTALGRASLSAAWSVTYLVTAELFPTVIRAIACGSASVAGRIGGILAPQVAFLRIVHPVIPGCIYVVCAIIALALAAVFLPETKDTSLPDTLPKATGGCCSAPLVDEEQQDEEELEPMETPIKTVDPTLV